MGGPDSTGGSALVSTKEDAFVQPSLQAASTSLAITGRTALLQELNELCGLLRPHAAGEGELHQAMRRAIGAMRQELMPLLQHAFAWELHEHQGAGHAPPAVAACGASLHLCRGDKIMTKWTKWGTWGVAVRWEQLDPANFLPRSIWPPRA